MIIEVRRGDPVKIIVQNSKRIGADIMVIGTNGKAGYGALWLSSITFRIFDKTSIPLLLAPI